MQARLKSTFRALSVRNYRLFASGQIVSLLGNWMQVTAQDWLVLKLSGSSPSALGYVTALQFLPILLLSLYGGRLADRYDKRRLLVITNAVYIVLAAALGLLVVTHVVELWHVFMFASVLGICQSLENPTRQAFASEMVPRDMLPNALALNSAVFNSARIIGPAVGGVTIALFGTGAAFLINAVTYVAPIIALTRMNASDLYIDPAARATAAKARIRDGLAYVRSRRDLVVPMVLILVMGLFAFNFQLTLPVLARNVFHRGPAQFGLLTTAIAVGALFGALAGGARQKRPSIWVVSGGAVIFGALETLLGFAPTFGITLAMLVPTGFFMIFFMQAANQRVQMGTDGVFRGRVMALYVLVFMGTTPVGAPLVGWCAEVFGPRSVVWGGGAVSMIAALVVLVMEQRRHNVRVRLALNPVRLTMVPKPAPETVLQQA